MSMTSISGLASGIDTGSLIEQLLYVKGVRVRQLEAKGSLLGERKAGLQELSARLLSFKMSAFQLSKSSTFDVKDVTSSNEGLILASGSSSAVEGSYTFTVGQLAQTSQAASNGFADNDTTNVGAGTLTIELGDGYLDRETRLSVLNGGDGVDPGSIRITDLNGASEVIDLSTTVTMQDVINTINSAGTVNVTAEAAGDRLQLTSTAGAGTFKVEEVGGNSTADDLGILTSTSTTVITGDIVNKIKGSTRLALLNDGLGIRRVSGNDLTISFKDATSVNVDLSSATDVQDVVDAINTAGGASITASVSADGQSLTLQDLTAGGAAFAVTDAGNKSNAALDLGLLSITASDSTTGREGGNADVLIGGKLIPQINTVLLKSLNGGVAEYDALGNATADATGVRDGTFNVTDRAGNTDTITINTRKQVDLAAAASSGDKYVDIADGDATGFYVGNRIRMTDGTSKDYRMVTQVENLAGANTRIHFTNGLSANYGIGALSALYVEHESVQDVMKAISDTSTTNDFKTTNLRADVSGVGNGIKLKDKTGATTSNLIISSTNTSTDLGIVTAGVGEDSFTGSNVDLAYIGVNTRLDDLNGGEGVFAGSIRLTDRTGVSFQTDISDTEIYITVGDVIDRINARSILAGSGIEAVINSKGDGILIRDTSGGTGTLKVEEVSEGTTGKDLNIKGSAETATPTEIDGSYEYEITISGTDTLEDVRDEINNQAMPVKATIVNDGDPYAPYRLNLVSSRVGLAGKLVVDATGGTDLSFEETAEAKDAVLLFGSVTGGSSPLLITSSNNTVSGAVQGLTLNLVNASSSSVTITVAKDTGSVESAIEDFVEQFNTTADRISELTDYNPDTKEKGVLLGDGTVRRIEDEMYEMVMTKAEGVPTDLTLLSNVGIKLAQGGHLIFDKSEFNTQVAADYEAVKNLFTYRVNRSLSTNGGKIFASSEDANFPAKNAANGNTDQDDYGAGVNGWKDADAGNDTLTVEFYKPTYLASAKIWLTDASTLGDFEVQVKRKGASEFITERKFSGNTQTSALMGFGLPILADAVRLKILDSGNSQVVEFEAFEDVGVGQQMDRMLDRLTNALDGSVLDGIDTLDDQMGDIDEQVVRLNERLDRERDYLVRQFTAMETAISEIQGVSNILATQLTAMSKN